MSVEGRSACVTRNLWERCRPTSLSNFMSNCRKSRARLFPFAPLSKICLSTPSKDSASCRKAPPRGGSATPKNPDYWFSRRYLSVNPTAIVQRIVLIAGKAARGGIRGLPCNLSPWGRARRQPWMFGMIFWGRRAAFPEAIGKGPGLDWSTRLPILMKFTSNPSRSTQKVCIFRWNGRVERHLKSVFIELCNNFLGGGSRFIYCEEITKRIIIKYDASISQEFHFFPWNVV